MISWFNGWVKRLRKVEYVVGNVLLALLGGNKLNGPQNNQKLQIDKENSFILLI